MKQPTVEEISAYSVKFHVAQSLATIQKADKLYFKKGILQLSYVWFS